MTKKETMGGVDPKKRAAQSIVCGMVIGFCRQKTAPSQRWGCCHIFRNVL